MHRQASRFACFLSTFLFSLFSWTYLKCTFVFLEFLSTKPKSMSCLCFTFCLSSEQYTLSVSLHIVHNKREIFVQWVLDYSLVLFSIKIICRMLWKIGMREAIFKWSKSRHSRGTALHILFLEPLEYMYWAK